MTLVPRSFTRVVRKAQAFAWLAVPCLPLVLGGAFAPAAFAGPAKAEAAAAAIPAPQEVSFEPSLTARQLERLGEAIGKYFEAVRTERGTLQAREELQRMVADLEGRDRERRPLLSRMGDLEVAFRMALGHRDSGTRRGRVQADQFDGFGGRIPYAFWVPTRYRVQNGPYPLILTLPAQGERPEDHLRDHWASSEIRDNAIVVAIGLPADVALWDAFGTRENSGGIPRVLQTFAQVRNTYSVDFDRVFLAGRGEGVAAALRIAALFPDRFAGVIGRGGDATDVPATNLRHVASFFEGGGPKVAEFQKRIEAAGYDNSTAVADAGEKEIWEWLSGRRRTAVPAQVDLAPLDRAGSSAYWIEIVGADPADDPSISASADRASNTITIRARNTPAVRLFFNDRLVDLDKPVRVVINGVEHEHRFERSLLQTLNRAFQSVDPGRVFTAQRDYDVTEGNNPE